MCKILVAVKNNGKNQEFRDLVRAQAEALRNERDGIGAVVVMRDNTIKTFRNFLNYGDVLREVDELIEDAKLVSIHTRTGTSGEKSLLNVHFFRDDGYLFAHNGWVNKYTSHYGRRSYAPSSYRPNDDMIYGSMMSTKSEADIGYQIEPFDIDPLVAQETMASCHGCAHSRKGFCKRHREEAKILAMAEYETANERRRRESGTGQEDEDDKIILPFPSKPEPEVKTENLCDSFQFLKNLTKPINIASLEADVKRDDFQGFGFLLSETEPEQKFLIVKKHSYLISDFKTYGAFFSYDPELKIEKTMYREQLGVEYKVSQETEIEREALVLEEGIYQLTEKVETQK